MGLAPEFSAPCPKHPGAKKRRPSLPNTHAVICYWVASRLEVCGTSGPGCTWPVCTGVESKRAASEAKRAASGALLADTLGHLALCCFNCGAEGLARCPCVPGARGSRQRGLACPVEGGLELLPGRPVSLEGWVLGANLGPTCSSRRTPPLALGETRGLISGAVALPTPRRSCVQ